MRRAHTALITLALLALAAPAALAQDLQSSDLRERLTGVLLPGDTDYVLGENDQLQAIYEDEVVGSFLFTGATPAPEFSMVIFGDQPATTEVKEGPAVGDRITFRILDASTNVLLEARAINSGGEATNVNFQGELSLTIPILGEVIPTRTFDMRVGGAADGGGGGADTPGNEPFDLDVNNDGVVDTEDTAEVLRIVMRGTSSSDNAERADVNRDGVVNTQDAIEIIRGQ